MAGEGEEQNQNDGRCNSSWKEKNKIKMMIVVTPRGRKRSHLESCHHKCWNTPPYSWRFFFFHSPLSLKMGCGQKDAVAHSESHATCAQ